MRLSKIRTIVAAAVFCVLAVGLIAGIDMGSREFRETILGEATEKAVKSLAAQLATKIMNSVR